jgi:hypothetical protein
VGTETGELATWPPAAVAVVVAALCTAAFTLLVAVVGGLWAVIRWRRDVAREQGDRAWSRFVWVVDHVTDADVGRVEIGRLVAGAMYNMQVLREANEVIGKLLLELVTEEEQT